MAVFDLMLQVSIGHTQQVLLQQLGAAQHRPVVREGRHEPDGSKRKETEELESEGSHGVQ